MTFPDSYFEDEVREGFFVTSMMKRCWAAQLQVLEDVDALCQKYNIKYYGDCGTLIGAVRHGGFIPWDDDLDICMLREDYELFLKHMHELPEYYSILNWRETDDWIEAYARIINTDRIRFDDEFMEYFHGFPYSAGLDIFVLDYMYEDPDLEEELEDARNALKRMQSSNGLSLSNSRRNIEDSERNRDYTLAEAADLVAEAKKAYEDKVKQEKELEDARDDAEDDADDAEDVYEALKKQLDATVSGPDADAAAAYEALKIKVEAAKVAYEQLDQVYQRSKEALQDYRDSEVVQKALDAYNQAVRSYDNTVASQDSMIASAKSGYTQTQLGNDTTSQRRAIEAYEKQLADSVLTAPVAGMVTHVNVEKGESYSPAVGAVVTIQDVSAFEIEAEIGQYDISDIAVGQHVLIKTDATGDEELEGTVIKVSPVASQAAATGSGVSYAVRISVDTPNDRLRLDMTASLSIIVTEHENALTVPYNAIQKDEAGNTFVEIPGEDGINNEKKYVHVVMESNYYTEIQKGDLEEGTTVIVIDSTNDYLQFFEEAGF